MTLPGFPDAAPMEGIVGGVLIGLAAVVMLLGLGRIAGISGIAARAVGLSSEGLDRPSAWLFLAGLPIGALLVALAGGEIEVSFPGFAPLVVAGLIVGFGTRLGSGCTSGHGVCGVSRFSTRSVIATIVFMLTGIVTVAAMNALGIEVLP